MSSFSNQTQSEYHSENISASMEGILLEHFSAPKQPNQLLASRNLSSHVVIHSFFLMTATRMLPVKMHTVRQIDMMKNRQLLFSDIITILDNTGGCDKQYRCATELYLLSMLVHVYNIIIGRRIGALGHGREVVYVINASNKRFISM